MRYLAKMSNAALFASLERLARDERRNLPRILARLAELDKRKAVPRDGSSLFDHCRRTLRWSEGETARRIRVARAADSYPEVYSHLWSGGLTLTTAALLAPVLTPENRSALIAAALRQSQRAVESLVATLAPTRERPEQIRPLGPTRTAPAPDTPLFEKTAGGEDVPHATPVTPVASPEKPAPPATPAPPSPPLRVEFTFTADESLAKDVEDARALLRNKYPFCRLEDLFREAVRSLLDRLDPARKPLPAGRAGARKPGHRRIPPAVRAYVWKRDKGRCAYVAPDGTRCRSRAFLEFDHIRPYALGGPSDDAANVRLLCRNHNIHMSRRVFGFI